MSVAENLKELLEKQKEMVAGLEKEISGIEADNLVSENERLKAELGQIKTSFDQLQNSCKKLQIENKKLKNEIYEQLYNEKIQLVNNAESKADIYYKSNIESETNRLSKLEAQAKEQMDKMTEALKQNRLSIASEILSKLDELQKELDKEIAQIQLENLRRSESYQENIKNGFEALRSEQITDEQINERTKQNNLEAFIGLNVMNKLGIMILIIGVIAASQFTYLRLNDTLKGMFAFIIGIIMLAAGELLNRKKPDIFSLGITSGGVAVLYVALVLSYFKFGILSTYPALGLCVLITTVAFVLSQRYDSQTITVFAMIGGYLPIFSIAGSKVMVYGAMVYFIVLNMLALTIAVNKKWIVTAYVGFVLNVIGTVYISSILFGDRLFHMVFHREDLITIAYIGFAFIIYTLIPVAGTYTRKLRFKNADIVLLALNTCISSLLMYVAFYAANLSDYNGVLAIAFACVYLALGRFIEALMTKEQKARALFYITGLTFVVLVIPLQFGRVWLSLGWLIEGVALLSYGIYMDMKDFKRAGMVISLLCLAAFILVDVLSPFSEMFTEKYFAVTLGSIIILSLLMFRRKLFEIQQRAFKYVVIANVWIFMVYAISVNGSEILDKYMVNSSYSGDYLIFTAIILISYMVAYITPRIKLLYDKVMRWISMGIYTIALVAVFGMNLNSPAVTSLDAAPLSVAIMGTLELVLIAAMSILALRELMKGVMTAFKTGIEWYPLVLSLYFVFYLTQNLVTQYNISFNSLVISIIYLVTALGWITFGFARRYVFIRRFGLGLSVISVAKLFLVDLSFLTEGYRIISYFVFGVILIAISFVYQYFTKKIDGLGEVISDEKKTDH